MCDEERQPNEKNLTDEEQQPQPQDEKLTDAEILKRDIDTKGYGHLKNFFYLDTYSVAKWLCFSSSSNDRDLYLNELARYSKEKAITQYNRKTLGLCPAGSFDNSNLFLSTDVVQLAKDKYPSVTLITANGFYMLDEIIEDDDMKNDGSQKDKPEPLVCEKWNAKERNKMLGVLLAIAMDKYGFDMDAWSKGKNNKATGKAKSQDSIPATCEKYGLDVDEGTIKAYLEKAIELHRDTIEERKKKSEIRKK